MTVIGAIYVQPAYRSGNRPNRQKHTSPHPANCV